MTLKILPCILILESPPLTVGGGGGGGGGGGRVGRRKDPMRRYSGGKVMLGRESDDVVSYVDEGNPIPLVWLTLVPHNKHSPVREALCVLSPAPPLWALPHAVMKWGIFQRFCASRSIPHHPRPLQVSPPKSQQCGQSATRDEMFSYSPEMLIAMTVITNI